MKKVCFLLPLGLLCLAGCGEMDSKALSNNASRAAERYIESQGGSIFHSRLSIAQQDLNGDGRQDAVVYIKDDPSVCTFEGCTLLILENQGNSLKQIGAIRNVHARLGMRQGESEWPTLIVASRDNSGSSTAGSDGVAVTAYALPFSNGAYPSDATLGTPVE